MYIHMKSKYESKYFFYSDRTFIDVPFKYFPGIGLAETFP